MSNPDSFVEEVTEELRRDRLFRALRRYGWIAALAVLLLVGGTAWVEWRESRAETLARERAAAIDAALAEDDAAARAAALDAVAASADGDGAALISLLAAAEEAQAGRPADAADRLAAVARDGGVSANYRRMARLKRAMLADGAVPTAARREALEQVAAPGGRLAPLANEQLGILAAAEGDRDAAIGYLRDAIQANAASDALRRRAAQLLATLGAEAAPA